jgi:putative heme-binding domain-containing protein
MKLLILVILWWSAVVNSHAADTLASLVRILGESRDPQFQLDILRGLREAMQGRQQLAMPEGWAAVERQFDDSANPEIRHLARTLGLVFGSEAALEALRATVKESSADVAQREDALRALVEIRDAGIAPILHGLLDDPALRGAAIRALAVFDDPATGPALIAAYPNLSGTERRTALNTFAARASSARLLLAAIDAGSISSKDLTAEVLRQLRSLKDESVNSALEKVYGTFREVGADKQAEIERYKRIYWAGGSTPGDAIRGRAVYAKVCQQCHTLFDVGGKVGPDLTGSNRNDLDYILQNIIDPNAVIPNEYVASVVDLKDGRVLTGIIQQQDPRSLTIATANEIATVAQAEVEAISGSQLSMMPEGLLVGLTDEACRDLIYYLGRPGQAPMLATRDTVNLFFNGLDLALWQGDVDVWSVDRGEIVGTRRSADTAAEVLRSDMITADFHLVFAAKLTPANAPAGLYFRAEPTARNGLLGYRLDLGGPTAGAIREQSGRGALGKAMEQAVIKPGEYNTCEIVASGSRISVRINGQSVQEFEDPDGARQGMIAFELGGKEPSEIRIREPRLELE